MLIKNSASPEVFRLAVSDGTQVKTCLGNFNPLSAPRIAERALSVDVAAADVYPLTF